MKIGLRELYKNNPVIELTGHLQSKTYELYVRHNSDEHDPLEGIEENIVSTIEVALDLIELREQKWVKELQGQMMVTVDLTEKNLVTDLKDLIYL